MAYTEPTVSTFKARFPGKFDAVSDDVINMALDEAKGRVDGSWPESDYTIGKMLYAAHVLTLDGLGVGAEAEVAAAGLNGFNSISSGSLSFTRGERSASSSSELAQTSYGNRFRELVRRNFPGILAV